MTATPVEWVITDHHTPTPLAIVRRLKLSGELYWRVATWDADPKQRRLVGYWGSLEEAEHNVMAAFDATAPEAWLATSGGTFRERRKPTPQKPAPSRKTPPLTRR